MAELIRMRLTVVYKILKNIPYPKDAQKDGKRSVGRPWKYPWRQMQPGDSVLFEPGSEAWRASLTQWKRRHPSQAWPSQRQNNGWVMVWRIK